MAALRRLAVLHRMHGFGILNVSKSCVTHDSALSCLCVTNLHGSPVTSLGFSTVVRGSSTFFQLPRQTTLIEKNGKCVVQLEFI